jgi:hypothetical protein
LIPALILFLFTAKSHVFVPDKTEDGLSADSASAPDMATDLVIRLISPSFTTDLYLAHRGKVPDMALGVPRVWALSPKLLFCSQPGRQEHTS